MSLIWNADTVVVAGLELALLVLVAYALDLDGRLPLSRGLQWVQRIRRSRLVPPRPSTAAAEPPMAKAVAEAHLKVTPTVKRGELTMGLVTGGYATVVGASYAILDSAFGLQGFQAALMTLNTLLLGYLFFLSGWWRNVILIALNHLIRRD